MLYRQDLCPRPECLGPLSLEQSLHREQHHGRIWAVADGVREQGVVAEVVTEAATRKQLPEWHPATHRLHLPHL